MFKFITKFLKLNRPVGGKDAKWIGFCDKCNDYEFKFDLNNCLAATISIFLFLNKQLPYHSNSI